MAVPPITGSQASAAVRVDAKPVQAKDKPEQKEQKAEFTASRSEMKAQSNKNIVEAMFGGGKQGDDKAMNILYSEIMSTINAELGADHAITPNKVAGQSDDYWSPENTAGRIVDGALGFFETFQRQNSSMGEEEQVEKFLSVITKSIDKGYGEATKVLDGLKIFDGSIKDNAEATRSLIDDKLAAFREAKLGKAEAE
ncbi:hypothetical protein CBP31_14375 [Oceanisphaera profunda]|uniref:DUF5610 domain-containing protein n=1 Tax=Oceanisphaera profunda TaxID=1416627 RepID=A0A1Y0D806_9GAMM|nr:DUF5610 domain-containing protein [Oceanisphaera profunda]ART83672.1 hypothetical protein CBP31_14375 [Oceanisphaera profunda]